MDLAVLGLVGEIGSLLSETKKKQRDASSYLGYEGSVGSVRGRGVNSRTALAGIGVAIGPCG